MPADILILKKRGNKIEVRITDRMIKGYAPNSYNIVVNLKDYKDLALFLSDLKNLQSAPIDKAIIEYQKNKDRIWPF